MIFSLERRDSASSKTVIFLDQEDELEDAYYPRDGSDIDEEDDSDTEGESCCHAGEVCDMWNVRDL